MRRASWCEMFAPNLISVHIIKVSAFVLNIICISVTVLIFTTLHPYVWSMLAICIKYNTSYRCNLFLWLFKFRRCGYKIDICMDFWLCERKCKFLYHLVQFISNWIWTDYIICISVAVLIFTTLHPYVWIMLAICNKYNTSYRSNLLLRLFKFRRCGYKIVIRMTSGFSRRKQKGSKQDFVLGLLSCTNI